MAINNAIEIVRQKCVEAHGEESRRAWKLGSLNEPVRLADVLLAIGCDAPEDIYQRDGLLEKTQELISSWNLRTDDLNSQSEETINFLAELLK